VPFLFSLTSPFGSGAASTLDEALPRAVVPITIVLNPPAWSVPWYLAAMRAARGEVGPPSLDDPSLTFRFWEGSTLALWTPPAAGARVQLSAAAAF
jgi:hypothetical protein